jgi:glucose-6-phosphate 1-dehydrogenase
MPMKNTTIILFGATGDLSKRKIIPALYQLAEKNKLENILIVGAAVEDISTQEMLNAARPFVHHAKDEYWDILQKHSYYKKVNFQEQQDFVSLKMFIEEHEKSHKFSHQNRLFYLATASQFFCPITLAIVNINVLLHKTNLDNVWHRIVYEKPFGHDSASAHEINECIKQHLDESQVYRIDHYLTKEVVSNIAMIRFTNIVFEPLWSNTYIDQVHITLSESIGIEGRSAYYDAFGALRDVVQNHMLELLALICMESPEKLSGDFIRTERAKILEKIRFSDGILGQCESYKTEKDIPASSHTETYALLQLFVDNKRWRDVPFYLKTGKYLNKKETVINIKFKAVDCLLLKGCPLDSNWLTITIDPESIISLTLNVKTPKNKDQIIPVNMEFCHSCIFGMQTPKAYEVLLTEIMNAEQSIAVRFDEITSAWKITDEIIEHKLPLYTYKKGSRGPQQAQDFAQKHGIRWKL